MAIATTGDTKTVSLNECHILAGGRMVPFAGYTLPLQYEGIITEHNWTRSHAGLFDVSHMGPCFLVLQQKSGDPEADHAAISAIIEPLICGDIAGLKPGKIRYTLLLNDKGGALDDLMIARPAELENSGSLYIVVNAGTKDADFKLIAATVGNKATLTRADDGALLALQGPKAAQVLEQFLPAISELGFMQLGSYNLAGAEVMVSRAGYTGEDGFEILCHAEDATKIWDLLLSNENVKPIGLGARDSLRLEAGLPLYGHDLDETVSPIEAGLAFAVSKRRRVAKDFPGAERILAELEGNLSRVRAGLFVEGAPAREGAEIANLDGKVIGRVTSGGYSPSLSRAIALGFVSPEYAHTGTKLSVIVRGRTQPAEIVSTPFIPHNYFRVLSAEASAGSAVRKRDQSKPKPA